MKDFKLVLVRIEDKNGDYGYCDEDDAQEVLQSVDGFRITARSEAVFRPLENDYKD